MINSLQKKIWRELWHIRGQAIAISMVIVGGVGVCIMSLSTYESLLQTRDNYYQEYGFADIFAQLKRAPESVLSRVREIPGVRHVQSRVVAPINLEVPGFSDPVSGLLNSIPDLGRPTMNRLHLLSGRMPDNRRDNEVLISDAFAEGQQLNSGDHIVGIINGRRRSLTIVGIALSPEYIYQIAPGAVFPDYERFGVLWMKRTVLAQAYGMSGAFNDLAITLQHGANEADVIDAVDNIIERYGGLGAYGRKDQFSNLFLQEEFAQLKTMAYLFPAIFLGVAVFLLNIVVTRLVDTQREVIAILKAFGYSNVSIALHYMQLVLMVSGIGILGGYVLGLYLGQLMTVTYTEYYRFPDLLYSPSVTMIILVALLTCVVAVAGTLRAVKKAAMLPPAEAMRPEPPKLFRQSIIEHVFRSYLSQASRMILRYLSRQPVKTSIAVLGLSMATAIMMVGNFQQDAVKLMMHAQFQLAQKQDIEVVLYEPLSTSVLSTFRNIEGVTYVEGMRRVPIKLIHEQRTIRTGLTGLPKDHLLHSVLNSELQIVEPPEQGLMVTEHLAQKMGFSVGDHIAIEVMEGKRQVLPIQVNALSKQFLGVGAYMRLDPMSRLLGEMPTINTVLLRIDSEYARRIYNRLREIPAIASINLRQSVINSFNNTLENILLVFTLINAILGGVIAFGVVYNTVRISLAERGRELASLRVLGYSYGEVAYIMLGELALLTLISIPLGFLIGSALCQFMSENMQSDLYRVPLVLSPYNFSFSALIVILSACASGLVVLKRLKHLDLVTVLKSRE